MTTATWTVAAFFLNCKKCGAAIPTKYGSEFWVIDEEIPATVKCSECGNRQAVPAAVRKLQV